MAEAVGEARELRLAAAGVAVNTAVTAAVAVNRALLLGTAVARCDALPVRALLALGRKPLAEPQAEALGEPLQVTEAQAEGELDAEPLAVALTVRLPATVMQAEDEGSALRRAEALR